MLISLVVFVQASHMHNWQQINRQTNRQTLSLF